MKLYENIVYNQISKKSRVIDLGCGEGDLLNALIEKKQCKGYAGIAKTELSYLGPFQIIF